MRTLSVFAMAAGLAVVFAAPVVRAQTTAAPAPASAPKAVLADHSMRASMLIGMQVTDDQGQTIGTVVDILVKNNAGEPRAVLSVGDYAGLSTKLVVVPLSHLKIVGSSAKMPGATKAMMIKMPLYDYEGGR